MKLKLDEIDARSLSLTLSLQFPVRYFRAGLPNPESRQPPAPCLAVLNPARIGFSEGTPARIAFSEGRKSVGTEFSRSTSSI
jgi:hypothetical protein